MRVSQPVVIGVNSIDESLGQRIRSYLFSVLRQQVKLYIILSFVLLVLLLLTKIKKSICGLLDMQNKIFCSSERNYCLKIVHGLCGESNFQNGK
jgi:hypothetical protein